MSECRRDRSRYLHRVRTVLSPLEGKLCVRLGVARGIREVW